MKRVTKFEDTTDTLPDRQLAAKVLGAWAQASSASGLPRERKINAGRPVYRMDALQQSGFAYPGLVRRIETRGKDGKDDPESDRETSDGGGDQAA